MFCNHVFPPPSPCLLTRVPGSPLKKLKMPALLDRELFPKRPNFPFFLSCAACSDAVSFRDPKVSRGGVFQRVDRLGSSFPSSFRCFKISLFPTSLALLSESGRGPTNETLSDILETRRKWRNLPREGSTRRISRFSDLAALRRAPPFPFFSLGREVGIFFLLSPGKASRSECYILIM